MKHLLAAILLAVASGASFAQPFDIDGREKLLAFMKANASASVKKDQLETSEEYGARLGKLKRTFRARLGTNVGDTLKYDADKQELTAAVRDPNRVESLHEAQSVMQFDYAGRRYGEWLRRYVLVIDVVPELRRNAGSFIGSNAYGAKTKVTRYAISRTQLAFTNQVYRLLDDYFPKTVVQMPREIARELLKGAFWEIEGVVDAVPTKSDTLVNQLSETQQGTLDDPREFNITTQMLPVLVRKLRLVDGKGNMQLEFVFQENGSWEVTRAEQKPAS